ncbi:MAG: hypothetical protein AB8F94_18985 [Saprospiraceae bacterium]
MQYRQLCNLTIRHAFYKNDQSPDFTILPTPECERLLRDYRLVVKYHTTGLTVMVPIKLEVDQTTQKLKEVPFLSMPESVELSFWLKNNNPALPEFTDFNEIFSGGLIRQPIFSNKDLPDSGKLAVHQMKAFQTDEFAIPENLKSFPIVLKNKPFHEGIDLHIFLSETNRSASEVLESWKLKFDEEERRGFSMEIMGEGTDTLKETSQFERLHPSFHLKYPGTDETEQQVEITYHGREIKPKIEVKQKGGLAGNAFFTIGTNPPQIKIESFPSFQGEEKIFPIWSTILRVWKTSQNSSGVERDNKGFRFKLIDGAGDQPIEIKDFEELKIQEKPEWVLPEIGLNGLRIIYNGGEKIARVKVSKGNINDFQIQNEPIFEITGITENNKPQFFKDGNALVMDVNEQDKSSFKITYPVQPTLPWGVFGQVKTQLKKVFFDSLQEPANIELDVRFEPAKKYWKYYVVSEIASSNAPNAISNIDQINVINSLEDSKSDLSEFFKLTLTDAKGISETLDAVGTNTGMLSEELDRLKEKIKEIEGNLVSNTKLNVHGKKRTLFVSDNKINCKEQYDAQLTLKLVVDEDKDIITNEDGIQPFTLEIPLAPPKNDEVQIIIIKEPEIATT